MQKEIDLKEHKIKVYEDILAGKKISQDQVESGNTPTPETTSSSQKPSIKGLLSKFQSKSSSPKSTSSEVSNNNRIDDTNTPPSRDNITSNETLLISPPPGERKNVEIQSVRDLWRSSFKTLQSSGQIDTPEYYISELRSEKKVSLSFVNSLKSHLTTCSKEWLSKFINSNGLAAIQFACSQFEIPTSTIKDFETVVCQTQLILCIKAVMNHEEGMESVIFVDIVAIKDLIPLLVTSSNIMMKTQVLSLLAAIVLYSGKGHRYISFLFVYSCFILLKKKKDCSRSY